MGKSSLATLIIPAYTGNYTKGRTTKISEITIHHMAGIMTAQSCGKMWQQKGKKTSSTYGIGNDGTIANYVDENDTAWCNSNWNSNCRAVSIEVSNSKVGGNWIVSDNALNSLIKLVADVAKRNNLGTLVKGKNVTWHSMYKATTCPGPYLLSKMDYIIKEANKLNSADKKVTTKTNVVKNFLPSRGYFKKGDKGDNVEKINEFYYKVFPGYGKKLKRNAKNVKGHIFGNNSVAWTKEFQRRTGLVQDGCIGPITLAKLVEHGFRY